MFNPFGSFRIKNLLFYFCIVLLTGCGVKNHSLVSTTRSEAPARQGLSEHSSAEPITRSSDADRHDPESPALLPARRFRFRDGGDAVFYAFTIGTPSESDPVFFFISGSGCATVRTRFPHYFAPVKERLNARFWVLQKRGIQEDSSGRFCSRDFYAHDFFDQTLADQQEFITTMLSQIGGSPSAVVLMGASEGAFVASRLAATEKRVSHLVLIGAGGSSLRQYLSLLSERRWFFRSAPSTFLKIEQKPLSIDDFAWGHTYRYWSALMDIDIGETLMSLSIPIVMAMGTADESVPVETALQLRNRFVSTGKKNFSLLLFDGADHRLLNVGKGESFIGTFLNGVVDMLSGKAL